MENKELKNLYEEFIQVFPPQLYLNGCGEPYGVFPFYKDEYHESYGGYDAIIVGNDTEITSVGDGKFKIYDYRKNKQDEILGIDDIIEYYFGIELAHQIELYDERNIAFRKGFKKGLLSVAELIDTKNEKVNKFNPNNN